MSFRTRRVLFTAPFYALFQFFLLKYIFLLIANVGDMELIVCELFYQDSSINHLLLIGHCSDIGCLQLLQGT